MFYFQEPSLKSSQAFPAGSGPLDRTTYMFTYVEPQPGSPKLEELLEEYWDLMPEYQASFLFFIMFSDISGFFHFGGDLMVF